MPIADFTFAAYGELIASLISSGYKIRGYETAAESGRVCILRHDVDFSLEIAAQFAEVEHRLPQPVASTYFVLIRSDFYNPFSKANRGAMEHILACGHEIGLHFDETQYAAREPEALVSFLLEEAEQLASAIGRPVKAVSMHRPSQRTLEANIQIPGMVNSYSEKFFKTYKYLSDSRMHWGEDVEGVIRSGVYERLHILTHPFWYALAKEDARTKLLAFIRQGSRERFKQMEENVRDLGEFIQERDI